MAKFKLLVKRFEEYTHVVEVEAPDLEAATEQTEKNAYADRYGDRLDKGYNQCYYEVTEHVVLPSDVTS